MEDQAERFLDELKRIDLLGDEQASQYRPRSVYLDPVFASFRNNDGDTLLHTAVEEGIGGGVVFLLEDETWRALVNTRNKAGQAPLYILSQSCEKLLKKSDGEDQIKKILKALLDNGADINVQDKNGWTPLHKAINIASSFMVDQILAADNVDVDRRTIYQGATPLHMAVDRALVGIMKSLIEKGADLTLTTHSGQSILHWALASAKFMEDEDKASIFGDAELVDDSPRASRGPSRAGTTKSQPPTPRHEKPMSYEDESAAFGNARFVARLPRASGGPSGSGMEKPQGQTPRDDKSKGDEDQASTFGDAGFVDLPDLSILFSGPGTTKSQTQNPRHDRYTSSYTNYGTDYGDEGSRGGTGLRNQDHVQNALRLADNMNTDDSENSTIMSRMTMIISILKGPDIWFQLLQIAYREPDQELVQFACHTLYPPPTESKWPVVRQLWMAMREDRFKGLESELRAKVRDQMQSRGPLIQVLTRDIDSWNALDLATYLDLPQVVRWLLRSKRWTKSEKEAAIRRGNGRDLAMDKPIWNEPFAQYTGTGRQKYRYPLKRSIKVDQLATKFQSSVFDVYSDSNRFGFIYHSSKVQELLYTGENAKGPEPSMNARVKHLSEKVPGFDDSTYRDSSFRFRWIHLPANCVGQLSLFSMKNLITDCYRLEDSMDDG
ncbi:putative ankyrin repeat domain protein [Rosellinia necatrix]|uniref:Putative ankyrin repeat domain protein n=1 Tax=Rosellinia necatrix TaxID=77044 RepID=A0A1S8A747_ROSNE|nr:putative ankyrin repeat domain protein [Rosellinia necatrix]